VKPCVQSINQSFDPERKEEEKKRKEKKRKKKNSSLPSPAPPLSQHSDPACDLLAGHAPARWQHTPQRGEQARDKAKVRHNEEPRDPERRAARCRCVRRREHETGNVSGEQQPERRGLPAVVLDGAERPPPRVGEQRERQDERHADGQHGRPVRREGLEQRDGEPPRGVHGLPPPACRGVRGEHVAAPGRGGRGRSERGCFKGRFDQRLGEHGCFRSLVRCRR
jgi:hypothetical protein